MRELDGGDCSGETSSPCRARCITAPPSNAQPTNATANPRRPRTESATTEQREGGSSAAVAGPGAEGLAGENAGDERSEREQRADALTPRPGP